VGDADLVGDRARDVLELPVELAQELLESARRELVAGLQQRLGVRAHQRPGMLAFDAAAA